MLESIGTMDTYDTMMTLFPRRENGYKFRVSSSAPPQDMKGAALILTLRPQVFSPNIRNIDARFGNAAANRNYNRHNAACGLGRLVATCRYMEHNVTQQRLKASITAMNLVL